MFWNISNYLFFFEIWRSEKDPRIFRIILFPKFTNKTMRGLVNLIVFLTFVSASYCNQKESNIKKQYKTLTWDHLQSNGRTLLRIDCIACKLKRNLLNRSRTKRSNKIDVYDHLLVYHWFSANGWLKNREQLVSLSEPSSIEPKSWQWNHIWAGLWGLWSDEHHLQMDGMDQLWTMLVTDCKRERYSERKSFFVSKTLTIDMGGNYSGDRYLTMVLKTSNNVYRWYRW